jgi:hypothetical protein
MRKELNVSLAIVCTSATLCVTAFPANAGPRPPEIVIAIKPSYCAEVHNFDYTKIAKPLNFDLGKERI